MSAEATPTMQYEDYLQAGLAYSGLTTKDLGWLNARAQGTANLSQTYSGYSVMQAIERSSTVEQAEQVSAVAEVVAEQALTGAEVTLASPAAEEAGKLALQDTVSLEAYEYELADESLPADELVGAH